MSSAALLCGRRPPAHSGLPYESQPPPPAPSTTARGPAPGRGSREPHAPAGRAGRRQHAAARAARRPGFSAWRRAHGAHRWLGRNPRTRPGHWGCSLCGRCRRAGVCRRQLGHPQGRHDRPLQAAGQHRLSGPDRLQPEARRGGCARATGALHARGAWLKNRVFGQRGRWHAAVIRLDRQVRGVLGVLDRGRPPGQWRWVRVVVGLHGKTTVRRQQTAAKQRRAAHAVSQTLRRGRRARRIVRCRRAT